MKRKRPIRLEPPDGSDPIAYLESLQSADKSAQVDPRPDVLSVDEFTICPTIFQPRQPGCDERHVEDLKRAIKQHGALDPVLVLPIDSTHIVIDGHHRLEAYRLSGRVDEIPVWYFDGAIRDAVLEAGRVNSKAQLPMTTQERMNYAWRLVRFSGFTRKEITQAASVSDGQVSIMRRAAKALGEDADSYPRWLEASHVWKGSSREDFTADEMENWMEAQAQDYADRLSKTFGRKLSNNPELAARALAVHLGRRTADVLHELREFVSEDEADAWDEPSDF